MSILPTSYDDSKLESYRNGSMPQGLGIGCDFDKYVVWKKGQYNMLLGVDNVGKTLYKAWYYTCLAVKHGLKFCIYSSENEIWSWKMKIMSFYLGREIKGLDEIEFIKAKSWVDNHFEFIDDKNFYTIHQLLEIFKESGADGCLIDPINALDVPEGVNVHQYNINILKLVRHFCKNTQKTIEIVAHCITEASRRLHTSGDFNGLVMPPIKAHTDGGQIFANRSDAFIILHRYFIREFKHISYISVQKWKETETGGDRTNESEPIEMHLDNYKFYINGKNPLERNTLTQAKEVIDPFGGLENNVPNEDAPF